MRYPVILTPDDNDTLLVTCPDLPEVTTFGEDEADALMRAVDAIETAIQGRMADRREIPEPSTDGERFVSLPFQDVLKIRLYRAMMREGLRKSDMARRLRWHPPQVDRLFELNHASRVDQIESAFHALGRELDVTDRQSP